MQNEQPISSNTVALDITLEDKDLLALIKKPISDSKNYWDNTFGLAKARKANMNLWLPDHWKDKQVYDYQEDSTYLDPRVFGSIETICATVNAAVPQLEITPAQEGVISLQAAKDLQKIGQSYVERYDVLDLFRLATRNLQLKRAAFIKLRWDPDKGRDGEVVCELVQVEDITVDQDAKMGEIPRFLAHRIRNHTVEELLALLPNGEQKILEAAGVQRRNAEGNLVAYKTQLGKKLDVYEVWFRYMEDGQTKSGVAWVDTDCAHVFDKDRNPNWNYDEKKGKLANFLDEPAPPFIPINYLNDGSSYFDHTSLPEQAAPLQKILNKRGFQIMENADQSGGGLIFNTQMISKGDMAKLVGSPEERIGVKGDVQKAMTRVVPPPLPSYVIEDKMDARNEIDNTFGTHDVTRGAPSSNPTLGQDNLQLQGDMTRMDEVGRAVERMAKNFFRYLFQMMKVYYTEAHDIMLDGEDGQFDHAVMKGDDIENGADVRITAGSMRAPNRASMQKWVSDLVNKQLIDPLSVYEVMAGGSLPAPRKMLERFMLFKTDPMSFMNKVKEDDFSREALMDIQVLNDGEMPKVRPEYDPVYLKFMNNYMIGGEFEQQSMVSKALYIKYLKLVQLVMAQQLAKAMTQMPTQQELDTQGQQAANQNALAGGPAGIPPAPGAALPPPGGAPPPPPPPPPGPAGGNAALAQRMVPPPPPSPVPA